MTACGDHHRSPFRYHGYAFKSPVVRRTRVVICDHPRPMAFPRAYGNREILSIDDH